MFIVRFKCPSCGEMFRKLGLTLKSDATTTCPKCGQTGVPVFEEDRKQMEIQEKNSCSSYG